MNTMKYLIDKYPDGYEGWAKEYGISEGGDIVAPMADISIADKPVAAVHPSAA
jgi:hypothetical protein